MFRKIFSLTILIGTILIFNVSFADYPQYLNGNRNYILCDGHMGTGFYVDANSLKSEIYNPPQYAIAIDVVAVSDAYSGKTKITDRTTRHYLYDLNEHYIYIRTAEGIRRLDPNGSRASGAYWVRAGEIAFELAYRMKFNAR